MLTRPETARRVITSDAGRRPERAFTLIEIVVALTIIAILVSLSLVVGQQVTTNSKKQVTRDLIKALETAQQSYSVNRAVPAFLADAAGAQFPIIDGRLQNPPAGATPPGEPEPLQQPSLALFMAATESSDAVAGAVKSDKYTQSVWISKAAPTSGDAWVREVVLDQTPAKAGATPTALQGGLGSAGLTLNQYQPYRVTIVRDPWGRPLRFVHKRWAGAYGAPGVADAAAQQAQVTKTANGPLQTVGLVRSPAETDAGTVTTGTGYFYSSGPDGNASTRDDNVYAGDPPPAAK